MAAEASFLRLSKQASYRAESELLLKGHRENLSLMPLLFVPLFHRKRLIICQELLKSPVSPRWTLQLGRTPRGKGPLPGDILTQACLNVIAI